MPRTDRLYSFTALSMCVLGRCSEETEGENLGREVLRGSELQGQEPDLGVQLLPPPFAR